MNIFQRAMAYKDGMRILLEWTATSGELVDREVAQRRADICARCPLNVKDWQVTEAVADAIRSHVGLKQHLGLTLANEDELHTCSACGCVNRLKVWLPEQFIQPNEDMRARLHKDCWLI